MQLPSAESQHLLSTLPPLLQSTLAKTKRATRKSSPQDGGEHTFSPPNSLETTLKPLSRCQATCCSGSPSGGSCSSPNPFCSSFPSSEEPPSLHARIADATVSAGGILPDTGVRGGRRKEGGAGRNRLKTKPPGRSQHRSISGRFETPTYRSSRPVRKS